MYKLVILIETPDDLSLQNRSFDERSFDELWPQFLHLVEQIPGLKREATSRVDRVVYGKGEISMIHELYFESLEELQQGMASPAGQEAGRVLQEMTGGRVTLLFADHKQDELENILKYRKAQIEGEDDAKAKHD
jgi:uncharacterized protein (TIGR02118 family)